MFYSDTCKTWVFDQSERAKGPIYIIKLLVISLQIVSRKLQDLCILYILNMRLKMKKIKQELTFDWLVHCIN